MNIIITKSRLATLCLATALVTTAVSASASNFLTGHNYTPSQPTPITQTYTVELNKTEVVQLPVPASAVIIGNPTIADISIHSSRTVFVIGRSYGETNLTILDVNGQEIMTADIQVTNSVARNGVRVFFGGTDRETYHCTPYCAAAPVLGDNPGFIGANSAAGTAINNTIALGAPNSIPSNSSPSNNVTNSNFAGAGSAPVQSFGSGE